MRDFLRKLIYSKANWLWCECPIDPVGFDIVEGVSSLIISINDDSCSIGVEL